jgi:hypothetical protein
MEEIGESDGVDLTIHTKSTIKKKPEDNVDPLTVVELEQAEELLVKTAQKELHERAENKEFNMLSPFTDDKAIIRVGGRVDKAIVTYDSKHPVLLPKNHHTSYLITKDVHQITHTGIASTAAKTRRKFWIIGVSGTLMPGSQFVYLAKIDKKSQKNKYGLDYYHSSFI